MLKAITSSPAALEVAGFLLAAYFRVVGWTNRVVREPEQAFYAPFDSNKAVIVALWHGEHFLFQFFGRKLVGLATTHRDGEILVRAGKYFGVRFLRGSGDHGREFMRKKALQAFTGIMRELAAGNSVGLTADVPKVTRVAGLGIVTLAKYSQCPIVPVAIATSRVHRLSNWDRTCINLPFGRMSMVRGEEIRVPRDADPAALEAARANLQAALEAVTERAYALAKDGKS